jgi:hypothetical protein
LKVPGRRCSINREAITKSQAKALSKALYPYMNYFLRLRKRMEAVGFPPKDKLYLLVCKACDAMQALSVEVHYLSCDGVGNPSKKDDDGKRPKT